MQTERSDRVTRKTEHGVERSDLITRSEATGPAWQLAEQYGFDMSLVESNLSLTHEQRLLQMNGAAQLAEMLKEAGKQNHA